MRRDKWFGRDICVTLKGRLATILLIVIPGIGIYFPFLSSSVHWIAARHVIVGGLPIDVPFRWLLSDADYWRSITKSRPYWSAKQPAELKVTDELASPRVSARQRALWLRGRTSETATTHLTERLIAGSVCSPDYVSKTGENMAFSCLSPDSRYVLTYAGPIGEAKEGEQMMITLLAEECSSKPVR